MPCPPGILSRFSRDVDCKQAPQPKSDTLRLLPETVGAGYQHRSHREGDTAASARRSRSRREQATRATRPAVADLVGILEQREEDGAVGVGAHGCGGASAVSSAAGASAVSSAAGASAVSSAAGASAVSSAAGASAVSSAAGASAVSSAAGASAVSSAASAGCSLSVVISLTSSLLANGPIRCGWSGSPRLGRQTQERRIERDLAATAAADESAAVRRCVLPHALTPTAAPTARGGTRWIDQIDGFRSHQPAGRARGASTNMRAAHTPQALARLDTRLPGIERYRPSRASARKTRAK